jgi:hypothetical protein
LISGTENTHSVLDKFTTVSGGDDCETGPANHCQSSKCLRSPPTCTKLYSDLITTAIELGGSKVQEESTVYREVRDNSQKVGGWDQGREGKRRWGGEVGEENSYQSIVDARRASQQLQCAMFRVRRNTTDGNGLTRGWGVVGAEK